ncbi:MAG: hypothetical protein LKI80_00885 [Sporolactobacillus sp.]|nr:hypothetical protein [Sporolactobacillus sp.]
MRNKLSYRQLVEQYKRELLSNEDDRRRIDQLVELKFMNADQKTARERA